MEEEDFWSMSPAKFFLLTKTHADMNDPEKAKKSQAKVFIRHLQKSRDVQIWKP